MKVSFRRILLHTYHFPISHIPSCTSCSSFFLYTNQKLNREGIFHLLLPCLNWYKSLGEERSIELTLLHRASPKVATMDSYVIRLYRDCTMLTISLLFLLSFFLLSLNTSLFISSLLILLHSILIYIDINNLPINFFFSSFIVKYFSIYPSILLYSSILFLFSFIQF